MTWIAGVDGCPSGWLVVLAEPGGCEEARVRVASHLSDVADAPEAPSVIAVDMPIGLPEFIDGSGRAAEQAVRSLLGGRQSSVFSIPSRSAVYASDYVESCSIALGTSQPPRRVSKQGFMIFPKIREIDALLRARPELASRVFEAHPEVAFWSMNAERALNEPKKVKSKPHEAGLAERRKLLLGAGLPAALVHAKPPRGGGPDDYIDALAALVVAREIARGNGRPFPDPPLRDAHGLPIAIWSFNAPSAGAAVA